MATCMRSLTSAPVPCSDLCLLSAGAVQPPHEGSRFQVEIQFSNGANYDPRVTKVMNDKPRENVQRSESVPLGEFRDHLSPWGSQSKAATMPASVLSTAMGPNNSSQTHLPASGPRSSSVAKSVSDPGGSIENM